MTNALTTQIELDSQGTAWISGTRVKVIEVVIDKLGQGWSAEEIHFQHPHLSLAQIHAALAYYYENQDRLDTEIRKRMAEAIELQQSASDPGFRRRLADSRP